MQKTLGMLRDLLIAVDGPPVDAMAGLGGKALSAAAMLSQGSEEVVGGIMATCLSNTKWLDSAAHAQRDERVGFFAARSEQGQYDDLCGVAAANI